MAVLIVAFWKAKTRLLVLKMVYGAQSSGSALPPFSVCLVTIATALSLAEARFSDSFL